MNVIQSGSILRFKLDHDFGFGYCKIVDFTKTNSLVTVIVKVYDLHGDEEFSCSEIIQKDYLLNPIRIYEYPNTKGKGAWKIIGNELNADDIIAPVFKKAPSVLLNKEWDESKCEKWWTVHDFYKDGDECDYKQIGHLENMNLFYKSTIIIRATMEIIKLRGDKIEDFYDVEDLSFIWHYFNSINVPFVKDIPKEFRGDILPKNILKKYNGIPFRSKLANPKAVVISPLVGSKVDEN